MWWKGPVEGGGKKSFKKLWFRHKKTERRYARRRWEPWSCGGVKLGELRKTQPHVAILIGKYGKTKGECTGVLSKTTPTTERQEDI